MIGDDDWCINYDKESRMCKIYETRPEFCVVDPRKFKTMFGVEQEDLNVRASLRSDLILYLKAQCCGLILLTSIAQDFCKFCCTEQIADVYGEDSDEMIRFEDVIDGLETEVAM